jgi:hypothetical protein
MFHFLCLLLSLNPWAPVAHAEVERPMIEVGAGVESQSLETFRVLLRVGLDGFTFHKEGHSTLVIATVRGDFATVETDNGRQVPYMDLEFVPLSLRAGDGLKGGSYRFLPAQFGTNVHLNEDATLRVDVVGIEKGYQGPSPFGAKALLYAKFAADALGYKLAARVTSDLGTFHGVSVAAARLEGGITVVANEAIKLRIAFGARADVAAGMNSGPGKFGLQSDFGIYNEITLEIKRLFRFFVRNGLNGTAGAGFDTMTEYQLMAGAQVLF